jgi:hypothetical protein
MKRNNILKIICFVLTLCVGMSFFVFFNSEANISAETTDNNVVVYDYEKGLGDSGELTEAELNALDERYCGAGSDFAGRPWLFSGGIFPQSR